MVFKLIITPMHKLNRWLFICGLKKECGPVFALHPFIWHAVNDEWRQIEASFYKLAIARWWSPRLAHKALQYVQRLASQQREFKWNVDRQTDRQTDGFSALYIQCNKSSFYCISMGNDPYLLPATDECTNSFQQLKSSPCSREKQLKFIKWYPCKNSQGCKKLCKKTRVKKVVKYRWWPRNGCDGRSVEKSLIKTIQVNLVPISSEAGIRQHKSTWIAIKILPLTYYHYSHHLYFTTFCPSLFV